MFMTRKIPAWVGLVVPAVVFVSLVTLGLGGPQGVAETFSVLTGSHPETPAVSAPAKKTAAQPLANIGAQSSDKH